MAIADCDRRPIGCRVWVSLQHARLEVLDKVSAIVSSSHLESSRGITALGPGSVRGASLSIESAFFLAAYPMPSTKLCHLPRVKPTPTSISMRARLGTV